ncbi:hypothetical protein [Bradyrhizobium sp. I1.14.4]|uniref:hypothetical protein n=1 Tax=unclassified Bradyrhizobium TaxID=2631580 RepID=UPI003D1B8164
MNSAVAAIEATVRTWLQKVPPRPTLSRWRAIGDNPAIVAFIVTPPQNSCDI